MSRKLVLCYLAGLFLVGSGLTLWFFLSLGSHGSNDQIVWYLSSEYPQQLRRPGDPYIPSARAMWGPEKWSPVYLTLRWRFTEAEWERSDIHNIAERDGNDFLEGFHLDGTKMTGFRTMHSVLIEKGADRSRTLLFVYLTSREDAELGRLVLRYRRVDVLQLKPEWKQDEFPK